MADGDGPAVDVDLGAVEAQLALDRNVLRAERLVDLEAGDVAELQPGLGEHGADRRRRADPHDLRRHAHRRAGDDAGERLGCR